MQLINLSTTRKDQLLEITHEVENLIDFESGFIYIYCPHTTAGLMINENADPDVKHDIILSLNEQVKENSKFKHIEGNSTAHVKSALIGKFLQIAVEDYKLVLGKWDGIYFCEFDGPRKRKVLVKKLTRS